MFSQFALIYWAEKSPKISWESFFNLFCCKYVYICRLFSMFLHLRLSVCCFQDNCTALHAAVSSGHVGPLKLLLHHPSPEPDLGLPASPSDSNQELQHPGITKASHILNHSNQDGWTAAHIAASRGYKVTCLSLMPSTLFYLPEVVILWF